VPSELLTRLADRSLPAVERARIADEAARTATTTFEAWGVLCHLIFDETDDMDVRVAAALAARRCGHTGINHLARSFPTAPRVRAAAVDSLRAIASTASRTARGTPPQ